VPHIARASPEHCAAGIAYWLRDGRLRFRGLDSSERRCSDVYVDRRADEEGAIWCNGSDARRREALLSQVPQDREPAARSGAAVPVFQILGPRAGGIVREPDHGTGIQRGEVRSQQAGAHHPAQRWEPRQPTGRTGHFFIQDAVWTPTLKTGECKVLTNQKGDIQIAS